MENPGTVVISPVLDAQGKSKIRGATITICIPVGSNGRAVAPISRTEFEKPEYEYLKRDYGNYDDFCRYYHFTMLPSKIRFDLKDPVDRLNFNLATSHPMVAPNKGSVNPKRHLFFVFDEQEEHRETVKKGSAKREAYILESKLTTQQKYDLLFLWGVNADKMTTEAKEAKLLNLIENDPQEFIRRANIIDRDLVLFFHRCVHNNIISLKEGMYWYNEVKLGTTMNIVIEYLKNPDNKQIRNELEIELASELNFEERKKGRPKNNKL